MQIGIGVNGMMKEITVICKNEVGALADICHRLGHAGVNMEAISAHGVGDKGIIRIVTSDPATAERILSMSGYNIRVGDVIIVKIDDRPGELAKVTKALAREGINLEAVYLLGKDKGIAHVAIKPAETDLEKVKEIVKGSLYLE